MPELPEVETIIQRLKNGDLHHPPVPGHIIQSIEVTWDRIIAKPNPDDFKNNIIGKEIIDARRRGKFLHFPLNKGHMIAHLRMSGNMRMERRLTDESKTIPIEEYDKVIINFQENWRLVFVSIRKFGRMWYVEDQKTLFGDLGPEPLGEDFSANKLYEMLRAHSRQIKPLLMDQAFIAGMGNVYTDEALFRAKIHPLRKSDSLSKIEAERLYNAIQVVLREGVLRLGTSLDRIYEGGQFQNYFRAYQQDGKPCPDCGTTIEKITVGQRGTHICPNCQEKPEDLGSRF